MAHWERQLSVQRTPAEHGSGGASVGSHEESHEGQAGSMRAARWAASSPCVCHDGSSGVAPNIDAAARLSSSHALSAFQRLLGDWC